MEMKSHICVSLLTQQLELTEVPFAAPVDKESMAHAHSGEPFTHKMESCHLCPHGWGMKDKN